MAERLSVEDRRQRILETAMAMIDSDGHRELTMRALARECNMSAPGVMHHFADMATLVTAVVQYRDRRDSDAYGDLQVVPGLARRILDRAIDNIVAKPKAAELFAIVEAQAIDPRHPGHEYFKLRAQTIVEEFAPVLGLEYAEPEEITRQLIAVMDGLQFNWLRDPSAFDLRARWDAIADAILGAATPAGVSWDEAVLQVDDDRESLSLFSGTRGES